MMKIAKLAALALAAGVSTPAMAAVSVAANGAVTVSGAGGGTWVTNYDGFGGAPAVIPGLTAQLSVTFVSAISSSGNTTFNFSYALTNTTSAPMTGSRVSGFGFDLTPDPTGAAQTGTFTVVGSGNVPNYGNLDICFKDGGGTNNCAGGGGGGVDMGQTGTGTFALTFAGSPGSIRFDNSIVRYQSMTGAGAVTSAIGRQLPPVPEPATWGLMLLGFGMVGATLRRRRRNVIPAIA